MPARIADILRIEVPFIVLLSEREMPVEEVVNITPGTLIELPKLADEDLEILIANKVVGLGSAVKVGENFGVKINFIGDLKERIRALAETGGAELMTDQDEVNAFAEALLAGNAEGG